MKMRSSSAAFSFTLRHKSIRRSWAGEKSAFTLVEMLMVLAITGILSSLIVASFNSILGGIAVFIGGFAFGHWVTNSDPAFLRILAKSERYKLRYDAAKQQVPRVEVR